MHAVGLDEALRDTSSPVVASNDGNKVGEPRIVPMAQRFFAAYPELVGVPGVYVRWLAPSGTPAGEAALASAPKVVVTDLDATRSPDGGLVVAWTEERDGGASLAFRTYDKDGQPRAQAVRIVDYRGPSVGKLVRLQIEAKGDKLHAVYEYDRPNGVEIRHQAVSLEAAAPGIDATAAGLPPGEHAMAREQILSRQDEQASGPALGCNNDGCYIAWNDASRGGGTVTFLDRSSSKPQWTKRLGTNGRRFAVGMAPNGQAQLAWYEGGKLVLAALSLEGPGAESRIAKVSGEPPAPSIAPGAQRGEWYAAWLDTEGFRTEPYVARVRCQ